MSEFFPKGARVRIAFNAAVERHDVGGVTVKIDGYDCSTAFVSDEMRAPGFVIEPLGEPTPPTAAQPVYDAWLTDRGLRLEALRLANTYQLNAEGTVKAAETFLAFLTGGAA